MANSTPRTPSATRLRAIAEASVKTWPYGVYYDDAGRFYGVIDERAPAVDADTMDVVAALRTAGDVDPARRRFAMWVKLPRVDARRGDGGSSAEMPVEERHGALPVHSLVTAMPSGRRLAVQFYVNAALREDRRIALAVVRVEDDR